MQISSGDAHCRYIAAPGTDTKRFSPFGTVLKRHGIELPAQLSLRTMADRGWVLPRLRVILPREAFDSWTNYPTISPIEADTCSAEHEWALNLYIEAMSGGFPNRSSAWWRTEFDAEDRAMTQAAMAHMCDPNDPLFLPPPFRHAQSNQEIRPWLDYFAYWQAFQVADYLHGMQYRRFITDPLPVDQARYLASCSEVVEATHRRLSEQWQTRARAFDWISRMRTVLGATVLSPKNDDEVLSGLQDVVRTCGVTTDQMQEDVQEVLLRMWSDAQQKRREGRPMPEALVHLLRQEIEYALHFIEQVSNKRVDFLDPFWNTRGRGGMSAPLIDALPREEELARREFPCHAEPYISKFLTQVPELSGLNREGISQLVEPYWQRSREFRRFALALHRLHEQLNGERLNAEEKVIRNAERIEQFVLFTMHAEKVLSAILRERRPHQRAPEVRGLAKESMNFVLSKWTLGGHVSRAAQYSIKNMLQERAQLHDLTERGSLPLVEPSNVNTGDVAANHLVAAFSNFVIARNYAAHHDCLDFMLVYPINRENTPHPGGRAIESVLLTVFSTLLAYETERHSALPREA